MASLKRNVVEHEPINNIFLNFLVEWEKKKRMYNCVAFVLSLKMLGSQRFTRALGKSSSHLLGLGTVFSPYNVSY